MTDRQTTVNKTNTGAFPKRHRRSSSSPEGDTYHTLSNELTNAIDAIFKIHKN